MAVGYSSEDRKRLLDYLSIGLSMSEIASRLGRSEASIARYAYANNIPRPKRNPGQEDGKLVRKDDYRLKALACFRHGQDLTEHHPKGCGELNIPPDGIPRNYSTYTNHYSVITSSAALCVEVGG